MSYYHIASIVLAILLIGALASNLSLRKRLHETRDWLRDEIEGHDRTKQHLKDAASRMRRENRERVLGLIEEQRD
jgi:hypothetical protein